MDDSLPDGFKMTELGPMPEEFNVLGSWSVMSRIERFEDIQAWQKARKLVRRRHEII